MLYIPTNESYQSRYNKQYRINQRIRNDLSVSTGLEAYESESKLHCNVSLYDLVSAIPSPCYVLYYDALEFNLKLLHEIAHASDCKILVALKGYSFWREFDSVCKYLHGATCSGAWEARLAYEEIIKRQEQCRQEVESFDKNSTHIGSKDYYSVKDICVFSPAYKESQMQEILEYATHIIFNSFGQWHRFKPMIDSKNRHLLKENKKKIEIGLRINPLYSEVQPPIYNPCVSKSRLGIIPSEFYKDIESYASLYGYATIQDFFAAEFNGLHFHTHCEQDSEALARTLPHVIRYFDSFIKLSSWINFGGGHHITREDYNCDLLISLIKNFKNQYHNIEIFLEPGEAVGWQCGDLIGTVVDIIHNEGNIAILDISASCHTPDCLEMPYRPMCYKISYQKSTLSPTLHIESDLGANKGKYSYRFGGPTCLAGDIIGDYSFDTELHIGDRVALCDMMHYTIVKNTTFNGIELPKLGVIKEDKFTLLKDFNYRHFKDRN
ncbi:carboxynorspermidine decarboxylase [Helicobacter aurati]|uniref:Carboxynorspermidine/carboxyspermidine decarboxylase n=2 Tax=Helicobacter aurati TaxID=137778 RepID=A0A3D8J8Q3_9HELI|nr:carboxynorspermidine decarboxylase [Helicobacter aurati]